MKTDFPMPPSYPSSHKEHKMDLEPVSISPFTRQVARNLDEVHMPHPSPSGGQDAVIVVIVPRSSKDSK